MVSVRKPQIHTRAPHIIGSDSNESGSKVGEVVVLVMRIGVIKANMKRPYKK